MFRSKKSPQAAAEIVEEKRKLKMEAEAELKAAIERRDYVAYLEAAGEPTIIDGKDWGFGVAKQGVQAAQYKLDEAESVLKGAERVHAEAVAKAQRQATEAAWQAVASLGDKRLANAKKIEKLTKELNDEVGRQVELSKEQFETAPIKDDSFGHSALSSGRIITALKNHFGKTGALWAKRPIWGPDGVPTLTETVRAGTEILLSKRPPSEAD